MLNPNPAGDRAPRNIDRRIFISLSVSAFAGFVLWHYQGPQPVEARAVPAGPPKMVQIAQFTDARVQQDVVTVPKIVKGDEQWKKQLSTAAFDVTRKADTEMAFTGDLLKVHDTGLFRCICCDTALYSSATKFESGTGWPSFWAPIARRNIQELSDNSWGVGRTAVSCTRCDAHLGHVFPDGPPPTGLRYCMNSVALRFVKSA